jgi:lipoprotein
MKKIFQLMLTVMLVMTGVSMISCNKEDDESNNVPQADPSELTFDWESGTQQISVRPTQGKQMTKEWKFVEAVNPKLQSPNNKERLRVDSTSTPGVKIYSNEWLILRVSDLGRHIDVNVLRNSSITSRSIQITGECNNNRFSFTINQRAKVY